MPGRGRSGPGRHGRRPAGFRTREHRRYRPAGRRDRADRHGAKALVDQGFKKSVVEHGKRYGIDVEIVERNPADKGFVPQVKRWVVEQTNGILMFYRRPVRDHEHRLASSRSRVLRAITSVIARRLTRATAPA